MACPTGYKLINGKCVWQYLPGDADLDGVHDGGLPEVVIVAPAPDKVLPKQEQRSWLARNWYWIVLPTVVAVVIWAWKKYEGTAVVVKITKGILRKTKKH